MKKNQFVYVFCIALISLFFSIAAEGCKSKTIPEPPAATATITRTKTATGTITLTRTIAVTATDTPTSTVTETNTQFVSPTISPTYTETPLPFLHIDGRVMASGGGTTVFFISEKSTPFPNATVIVDGTLVPYFSSSGSDAQYRTTAIPYVYDHIYAVTITAGTLSATEISYPAPGGISFAPDGLSVTWTYEGSGDYAQVYNASMTNTYDSSSLPDLTSPAIIPGTAYPLPGNYTLHMVVKSARTGSFDNPAFIAAGSLLSVYQYINTSVVK